MGFGGPIGLIVVGLILALAFNQQQVGPLEVTTLGWILVLAGVIFHWNFSQGLFLTGLIPALLLGIPAFLLNALRYLVFGFALSPALLGSLFLVHLPTLVLELQAYILVTFGGLVLLAKTAGGEGYRKGLRALLLTFYLGALFLLLAAWYEAWEVSVLL